MKDTKIDIGQALEGFAIGLRYRANFSIEDQIGKFADQILYSKDAYFNSKIFPMVNRQQPKEAILFSPKGGGEDLLNQSLIINNSNIILDVNFNESLKKDAYSRTIEKFNTDIIEGIVKNYGIVGISRIGLIKRYSFDNHELIKSIINKITNLEEPANEVQLRFSKKFPTEAAFLKQKVYDHRNVIYILTKQIHEASIKISVDYQYYFDPLADKISQIKFTDFIKRAEHYNQTNFQKWLAHYL